MSQHKASEWLEQLFQGSNTRSLKQVKLLLLWPEVAGPELAKITRPLGVDANGILRIGAQDAVISHYLSLQRLTFLGRLHERIHAPWLRDLRFVVAPIEQPETKIEHTLSTRPREEIEPLIEGASEDFKPIAEAAAQAIHQARELRKAHGWTPCVVCGTHTPSAVCWPCRDLLEDRQVQVASRRLACDPTLLTQGAFPHLSFYGLQAARHLALQYLEHNLEKAAFDWVSLGSESVCAEVFRSIAECFVCLSLKKHPRDLRASDFNVLPHRWSSLLNRDFGSLDTRARVTK